MPSIWQLEADPTINLRGFYTKPEELKFSNAAAMAREEGIDVDLIKVADDIAVCDSLYTVGRRGVAGTVLVHKVVGAAAEEGLSLKEVKKIGQHAADQVRTIGFAFDSCTVPAARRRSYSYSGRKRYPAGKWIWQHAFTGIIFVESMCLP